jgi:hypothetical protein
MQLTFISAEKPLTKSYINGVQTASFQNQKNITSRTETVTNLKEFYDAIKTHSAQGHALMKGHFDRKLENESRANRTAHSLQTFWLMLDIDGLDGITAVDDLFEDIPELANTSYVLQYSASYKIKHDKFNAHVFFMLEEPIQPRKLKVYLKSLNLRPGIKVKLQLNEARSALKYLIDPTVADESRIIYIAPPLSNKKLPLQPDDYVQLIEKDNEKLVLPPFNPGTIDEQLNSIRDELRKAEGLKPKKGIKLNSDINGQTYELDTNPDSVKIYVEKVNVHSGWVTCNVNDGDSAAYYFPIGRITQQTIMRNFKHEPYFYIAKADPEFQKEWNNTHLPKLLTENPELGKQTPEDLNHDLIGLPEDENHFVAFDIQESSYKVVRFNPENRELEITRHELEKLQNYCATAGIEFPEVKPIYRFLTDISCNNNTPICHEKREVNSWILPKLLDPSELPMPEDIPPRSLPVEDVIERIKTECPLIWSQLYSAFAYDEAETLPLFLNWYALAIFHRVKLRTAWILQGTQGTGKSFITQNLTRGLLNDDANLAPNKSLDVLTDLSNAWMEHAVFVEWEESSTNKTIRDIKIVDDIKRIVTGKSITLRKMRTDGVQHENHLNCVFTTNHNAPFHLDESDRRFFVAPRQAKKWQHQFDEATFAHYDEHFETILEQELPNFAVSMHLLATDITKANNVIMNNAKKHLIDGVKTTGQGLLEALMTGDIDWIMEGLDEDSTDPTIQIILSTAKNIIKIASEHIKDTEKPYILKWSEIATLHAALNGDRNKMSTKKVKAFALNQGLEEQQRKRNDTAVRGICLEVTEKSLRYARGN